jgi:predicted nucleotidyltransferase
VAVRPEDLAEALVTRHRAAREEDQRRGTALRRVLEATIAEAIATGTITRGWLIGSLSRGDFGAASDVDVVVEGLSAEDFAALWADLAQRLDATVDLLRLEELPPSFRDRVLREGLVLGG